MAAKPRSVNLSARAAKVVASVPAPLQDAIKEALRELSANPLLGLPLKGEFKGLRRYRVGRYRIVYLYTSDSVEVVNIADRKDVYR